MTCGLRMTSGETPIFATSVLMSVVSQLATVIFCDAIHNLGRLSSLRLSLYKIGPPLGNVQTVQTIVDLAVEEMLFLTSFDCSGRCKQS